MTVDPMKICGLIFLLIVFLFVPNVSRAIGSALDTLPIRFLAIILILGSLSYDKYLALGVCMVVIAIYIHHHHRDIFLVLQANRINGNSSDTSEEKYTHAMQKLDHGGVSDESYDTADFTSKSENQDNEFRAPSHSIDEKHTLDTEPLGTRSERLFPDDSKHLEALEHGNKNGYSD